MKAFSSWYAVRVYLTVAEYVSVRLCHIARLYGSRAGGVTYSDVCNTTSVHSATGETFTIALRVLWASLPLLQSPTRFDPALAAAFLPLLIAKTDTLWLQVAC
eukprot:scaffold62245_cov28-Prasinocladus_malaysianus.AAC.1